MRKPVFVRYSVGSFHSGTRGDPGTASAEHVPRPAERGRRADAKHGGGAGVAVHPRSDRPAGADSGRRHPTKQLDLPPWTESVLQHDRSRAWSTTSKCFADKVRCCGVPTRSVVRSTSSRAAPIRWGLHHGDYSRRVHAVLQHGQLVTVQSLELRGMDGTAGCLWRRQLFERSRPRHRVGRLLASTGHELPAVCGGCEVQLLARRRPMLTVVAPALRAGRPATQRSRFRAIHWTANNSNTWRSEVLRSSAARPGLHPLPGSRPLGGVDA